MVRGVKRPRADGMPAWARDAKRRFMQQKRRGIPRTIVPYNPYGVLGASVQKTHKYRTYFTLNPGAAGAISSAAFRVNGMFDPEVAIGGHQPMAFDQMAELYNHYTVYSASICCTMINKSGDNITFWCLVAPSSSAPTNADDALEYPGTVWDVVQVDTATGASHSMSTIKKSVDLSKYFSKSKSQLINSSLYRGDAASDPTEQAYFIVQGQSWDLSQDPGPFQVQVVITYNAIWTEPKRISGS